MSGALSPLICVERTPGASSYVVTSNLRLLPGYFVANPAATDSSVGVCAGSSPPPRQQYQRSAASSKSGMPNVCAAAAVGPPVAGGPAVGPPALAVPVGDDVGPPQAAAATIVAASSDRTRLGVVSTSSSLSTQPASAGSNSRDRLAPDRT